MSWGILYICWRSFTLFFVYLVHEIIHLSASVHHAFVCACVLCARVSAPVCLCVPGYVLQNTHDPQMQGQAEPHEASEPDEASEHMHRTPPPPPPPPFFNYSCMHCMYPCCVDRSRISGRGSLTSGGGYWSADTCRIKIPQEAWGGASAAFRIFFSMHALFDNCKPLLITSLISFTIMITVLKIPSTQSTINTFLLILSSANSKV